ncbi:hypothetical protein J4E93_010243 [Alternaria ventricosa]|uniref:uncharacterized protein n=1 Tax=Alternaria ventricosa TaxID=1187951 RepID=UPI0020C50A92|nr:uncharacterized protein J4E93_010243 [Alternaria ventricosa]KAI4638244.1 hypothetical protein J4E93_010243 [Alternaria ventricosa]
MALSSTSSSAPAGQHPHTNTSSTEPEKTTEYASIIPQPRSNEADQDRLQLQRTVSSVSHHDMANVQYIATGDNDVIYNKFTERRKMVIVAVVSFCSFLAPISSTTVLSAVPEVAETFDTDGSIINVSNALYMLFMGLSPCFYGPYGNIYVIGDIYKPTERATALGWFLSGTLIGPALGPFIGGIIVTFRSWRDIFWLQTALAGAATLFCFFLQPETIHKKRADELVGLPAAQRAHKMWQWLNPFRVVKLYRYPNILLTALASSSLVWNMYSLLTPIRYVLNPRFNLQSPLQSGLFYIAPGCGYLLGTFFGGRYADHIVKKYIQKRGHRVSEDRLRSCVFFLGGVIPACMLIYGWSVEKRVGGIALPVVMMFLQGVAQLFCFPSLNTYCLDVMQGRSAEVVAGNYFMRYMFAAAGSAACLPAVRAIGVGWFSTISAGFLVAGAGATWLTAVKGREWREGIEERKAQRKEVALA